VQIWILNFLVFFYERVSFKFEGYFIQLSLLQMKILILCLTLFNNESKNKWKNLNFKFNFATEIKELEFSFGVRRIFFFKVQSSLCYRNILKTVLCAQFLVTHS